MGGQLVSTGGMDGRISALATCSGQALREVQKLDTQKSRIQLQVGLWDCLFECFVSPHFLFKIRHTTSRILAIIKPLQ